MARNLKKENIKKLASIETSNGFKIDLANYAYNPSFNHEYPNLKKLVNETETEREYKNIYYFKYYDGTGKYFAETYTSKKNNDGNVWSITTNRNQIELEENNRFNLKKLIALAENIEI